MKGNKIVLDLEFTPLRDPDLQAVAGNEIIEIGAVKLDEENRKLDSFQTYVKPQYSDIPYRITQITGITKKTFNRYFIFRQGGLQKGKKQTVLYLEHQRSERDPAGGRSEGISAARYVLCALGGSAANSPADVRLHPSHEPNQRPRFHADLL